MFNIRKLFSIMIIAIFVIISTAELVEARRGGSFSSSRSGFSSSKSSKSWGSRSTAKSNKSWNKGSLNYKPNPKIGKFDKQTGRKAITEDTSKKIASTAAKKGVKFDSRKDALQKFKDQNANKYKSTYTSRPDSRPEHIPETTRFNGKTYDVTYNPNQSGYGYIGPSGSWIMYDTMSDMIMMNMLMSNQGYYYPGLYQTVPAHVDSGVSFIFLLGSVICIVVIGIVVAQLLE